MPPPGLIRFFEDLVHRSFSDLWIWDGELLKHVANLLARFPLLMKPIAGRKGRGIVSLTDVEAALHHVEGFFKRQKNPDIPVFI